MYAPVYICICIDWLGWDPGDVVPHTRASGLLASRLRVGRHPTLECLVGKLTPNPSNACTVQNLRRFPARGTTRPHVPARPPRSTRKGETQWMSSPNLCRNYAVPRHDGLHAQLVSARPPRSTRREGLQWMSSPRAPQ